MEHVCLIFAMLSVMLINTVQGCTLASLKKKFSKKALKNGLFKSFIICLSFVGLYITVYFIPEFSVMGFNGVNIIDGICGLAIIKYATDIASKLVELIGIEVGEGVK